MNKKKIDINSTEPINSIAEVDSAVDEFVKRGGYITLEEDLKIRKRITSRNHLALWINYVKNKLVYTKHKIFKHIPEARKSFKGMISPKRVLSPVVKPLAKEKQDVKVVTKRSLNIDSFSDICNEDPTLRPYQQKAKKDIFESWDEVDNVMFQMPTGTGKTRLFTSIIRDINQYSLSKREAVKILIIAHRTELIDQIDESLKKYHVAHNVIGGSKKKRDEDQYAHVSSIKEISLAKKLNEKKFPVHVASIQTLMHKNNLNDAQKLNVQFIIIDEAHHALADTYKKIWDLYPGSKKLGVTATPWRMNHQSFTDLFDKLVMSMPIKDFIKQGYLSTYVYYSLRDESFIQKAIDDIELDRFGEYDEESMEKNMDIGRIRAQLLNSYQSLAKDKKGIIYAINKKHARNIQKEYEEAGYRVVAIDSETPDTERNDYVNRFKKGEIDIIVNVDIFSEGFDCPDIEFIQLARPTRSLVKYLQQVGRGLRITENKEHCIILDNVGMYSRFGLPDARRPWKYHFLGHDVEDEEEPKRGSSKGTGRPRFVDMSEGTEDMELIQEPDFAEQDPDVSREDIHNTTLDFDDLFPLWGIIPGKTTWKDAENMGIDVEIWKSGPARTLGVNGVNFWDHKGIGIFNYLYWVHYIDFPNSWKSYGFSWDNSYEEWLSLFKRCGFEIKVINQPQLGNFKGRTTFKANFTAIASNKESEFRLDFDFGEEGHLVSSPKTLYSFTFECKVPSERKISTPKEYVFFPLWGITLGKTTWQQAEDLGYEVVIDDEEDEEEEEQPIKDRYTIVNKVSFWAIGGKGVFTSLYWRREKSDFVDSWKAYGFSWNNSYDKWVKVFLGMGYKLTITTHPYTRKYKDCDVLIAEFKALSPNKELLFRLVFGKGEYGCLKSSPRTLSRINLSYKGSVDTLKDTANVVEPEIKSLPQEDIDMLQRVFDSKATSYKYFWFMSILHLLYETEEAEIDFNKILIKMVAIAWKYVFVEDGEFSLSDQLPIYLQSIKIRTHLKSKSSEEEVERVVAEQYDALRLGKFLSPLLKNVPYRFLSPWIRFSGNNDVITKSQSPDIGCLYELHDDCITIKELWKDYLFDHYDEVMEFIENDLRLYLKI